jgi:hypothetical protein
VEVLIERERERERERPPSPIGVHTVESTSRRSKKTVYIYREGDEREREREREKIVRGEEQIKLLGPARGEGEGLSKISQLLALSAAGIKDGGPRSVTRAFNPCYPRPIVYIIGALTLGQKCTGRTPLATHTYSSPSQATSARWRKFIYFSYAPFIVTLSFLLNPTEINVNLHFCIHRTSTDVLYTDYLSF